VIVCCKTYRIFWSSQYSVRLQLLFPHRCKFFFFFFFSVDDLADGFWITVMIASTTNFDLFPSSEVNRVTRCRFCDDKRADDHEKARVSAVSKKN
jgi:hypothetical protein